MILVALKTSTGILGMSELCALSICTLRFSRYSYNKDYIGWQLLHGRAFVFARTDWEYVFNTFAFGYAIGYHFLASTKGSCNGNFLGIGADMAVRRKA